MTKLLSATGGDFSELSLTDVGSCNDDSISPKRYHASPRTPHRRRLFDRCSSVPTLLPFSPRIIRKSKKSSSRSPSASVSEVSDRMSSSDDESVPWGKRLLRGRSPQRRPPRTNRGQRLLKENSNRYLSSPSKEFAKFYTVGDTKVENMLGNADSPRRQFLKEAANRYLTSPRKEFLSLEEALEAFEEASSSHTRENSESLADMKFSYHGGIPAPSVFFLEESATFGESTSADLMFQESTVNEASSRHVYLHDTFSTLDDAVKAYDLVMESITAMNDEDGDYCETGPCEF